MRISRFRSGANVYFTPGDLAVLSRLLEVVNECPALGSLHHSRMRLALCGAVHEITGQEVGSLEPALLKDKTYQHARLAVRRTKGENDASVADEALFRGWLARVRAGLGPLEVGDADDVAVRHLASERFRLIEEIHNDVAARYPLGIAEQLSQVVTSLHVDEDQEAINDLEDLAEAERKARELNGASSTWSDVTHLGFLGDRKARCGSKSLLKSPDPAKITCRSCTRELAGEASLEHLLVASFVMWGQRVPFERALEIAQGQRTPTVFGLLAQELQSYFADGGRGEGRPLVLIESERLT